MSVKNARIPKRNEVNNMNETNENETNMNAQPDVAEQTWDEDAWNESTKSDYVNFDQPVKLLFQNNNFRTVIGQNGKPAYEFDVFLLPKREYKTLSTQSKRLMKELKKNLPIAGKTFLITRAGEGFATTYSAVQVA